MKTHLTKLILITLIFIGSCSKDDNNDSSSVSNSITIDVMGQIKGENGQPLSNVSIIIGNKTTVTNLYGIYSINDVSVSKTRTVLRTSLAGYWDCSKGFIPSNTGINYCSLTMPLKNTNNVNGTTGGTVSSNGANIIFPANAFVNLAGTPYTGNVIVAIKHLPTTDANFASLIPGGDLRALNSAGEEKVLISYGMVGVELFDNSGTEVLLAPGKKATIQLPIAASQQAAANATIPLWYFDVNTQLWKEEGVATRQGNNYVGEVSHFSWWNCDDPGVGVMVSGYVVDCKGAPFPNALVYSPGSGYIQANSNGYYSGLAVAGITHSVFASSPGFVSSQTETSPVLVAGQPYVFPDLVIPCASPIPTVTIVSLDVTIIDCDSLQTDNYLLVRGNSGQFYFNTNSGHVNMTLPCGFYFIESTTLGATRIDSINVGCVNDTTFHTIQLCSNTNTSPSNLGFSIQLSLNNFNLTDSITVPVSVNPTIPLVHCNDLTVLTHDPGIGIYMSGVPYAPGLYNYTSSHFIQIAFRTNNVLYEVTPNTSSGNTFFTEIIQAGAPNDTIEFEMFGDVNVQDLNTGLFYTSSLTSFRGKFIRP